MTHAGAEEGQRLPASPKIARWRQEWEVIRGEGALLAHNRRMYREIMAIVNANPDLPKESVVWGWILDAHVALVSMAIRRLVDRRGDVISVVRVLREIVGCSEVITRAWFVSQYESRAAEYAQRDFDRFDPEKQGFVDEKIVATDLAKVQADAAVIEAFVNKYVAHRDTKIALRQAAGPDLTFGELNTAIDSLAAVLENTNCF